MKRLINNSGVALCLIISGFALSQEICTAADPRANSQSNALNSNLKQAANQSSNNTNFSNQSLHGTNGNNNWAPSPRFSNALPRQNRFRPSASNLQRGGPASSYAHLSLPRTADPNEGGLGKLNVRWQTPPDPGQRHAVAPNYAPKK